MPNSVLVIIKHTYWVRTSIQVTTNTSAMMEPRQAGTMTMNTITKPGMDSYVTSDAACDI